MTYNKTRRLKILLPVELEVRFPKKTSQRIFKGPVYMLSDFVANRRRVWLRLRVQNWLSS